MTRTPNNNQVDTVLPGRPRRCLAHMIRGMIRSGLLLMGWIVLIAVVVALVAAVVAGLARVAAILLRAVGF